MSTTNSEVGSAATHGVRAGGPGQVDVTTLVFELDPQVRAFSVAEYAPLSEVLNRGLELAGQQLSPVPVPPVDKLFNLQGTHIPVDDLDQPTGPYVQQSGHSSDFGIRPVLAIRVNTRWNVASAAAMTPRQILALFALDPQEFSLYRASSPDLLPPDTELPLYRGDAFEAQRDGKYGLGGGKAIPAALVRDVEALKLRGTKLSIVEHAGQCYLRVHALAAPQPPWDQAAYDILIAIPAVYDDAALDGFYLALPYTYNKAQHDKVNGPEIQVDGKMWKLASWQYHSHSYTKGVDSLESYIEHWPGLLPGTGGQAVSDTQLRMTEADWKDIQQRLRMSFSRSGAPETGIIGVVGESSTSGWREYTLAHLVPPGAGDLKIADQQELVFDASYIRRAHLLMRERRMAGLFVLHTHPCATDRVDFSCYDDAQEPKLVENLQEMAPSTRLCSVVVGRNSLRGRVWTSPRDVSPLSSLVAVGETLQWRSLDGREASPSPSPAAIFDRALALTGAGALAQLAGMTVAVVGASGTGSLVAELLVRAGCRRILLIDDDILKDVNLNRILHSLRSDVDRGTYKVDLLKRELERIGLGCTVEPIRSNVLIRETLLRLREADVVFGCVDKAMPRLLLSQIAFQYLKPYIDVGTEIGADETSVVALIARTNLVAPGRHCLSCTGLVTPRRLRFESLTAGERAREQSLGYSDDLVLKQPAVMDLNMHAAGMGMMLLRHLLQPFLLTPFPAKVSENLVTYATLGIKDAAASDADCAICKQNPHLGYGDCGPELGFDPEVVKALCGQ